MNNKNTFNLIGKDLERLKRKLAPSKSGLEPDEEGNFPVDPTVTFTIPDPEDKYPTWKLTTYVVDSETYKTAMADEMNTRRIDKNPAHFTKDGKLKFINVYEVLDIDDCIAVGQDGFLTTIWLMWKNRQLLKTGNYKATKISKLISKTGTDGGTYVDVVSIPHSAWVTLRDYFYETVSEDGTVRIERLLNNGVEGQDFNKGLLEIDKYLCNDMSEEQRKELLDKKNDLLAAFQPIAKEIETDLCRLYSKDIPAIMFNEQLSEVNYQKEIEFIYQLTEKAQEIDDLYAEGKELMMITYLDCPSFEEYCDYHEKTKKTVKG